MGFHHQGVRAPQSTAFAASRAGPPSKTAIGRRGEYGERRGYGRRALKSTDRKAITEGRKAADGEQGVVGGVKAGELHRCYYWRERPLEVG